MSVADIVGDETARRRAFPVTAEGIFLAHAGVSALPRAAKAAMAEFARRAAKDSQENDWAWKKVAEARAAAARLLGCDAAEIALLGPTSLGLNLVANGLPWEPGDEVLYYPDDYPANVYPWSALRSRGVRPVPLHPEVPGWITWDLLEAALTDRTRLVALASCHFLSGCRIDVSRIGRSLAERGVLFCVDGIQSLGAFPLSVEHVDFLSADSHKWLLGPVGAGIFYVKRSRCELLRPSLLGSWNVVSPQFIAQSDIAFEEGARRYEPGTLNLPGILGMLGSLKLLLDIGVEAVGQRILELRRAFLDRVRPLGYRLYTEACDLDPATSDAMRSGIISLTHPARDVRDAARHLAANGVKASLRQNRAGLALLRLSPHFYNTHEELERVAALLE